MKLNPQTVDVPLRDRSYSITVATHLLEELKTQAEWLSNYQRAVIVTDSNVSKLFLSKLKRRLKKQIQHVDSVVCPAGEKAKVIEIAYSIWQKMFGFEADRHTLVVALGGGVVGDLAGFVAATYMRGLDLLQIPTTLLSQVDSSVGGKVGINLPQGKNLIGAFWQPKSVWIDPAVLESLPPQEFRAGMAEVIKYGVIMDADFFAFLQDNVEAIVRRDNAVLASMIVRCCQLKAEVVVEDERETSGRRAILNFGHTYGHAFENVLGYGRILHGEAIAIGMVCASRLAVALGMLEAQEMTRLVAMLQAFQLPTQVPKLEVDAILQAMKGDKKKVLQAVQLVLPTAIGQVQLVPWPGDQEVQRSLINA